MIELGEVRVQLLSDGVFAVDGGAMFGVVPRVVGEARSARRAQPYVPGAERAADRGRGRTLVMPTDVLPTVSHLPLAHIMSYDLYPVGTLQAKRAFLRQVAEDGRQVVFYHDPRTPVGGVRVKEGRYVLNGVSL
jgi:hypothetical protein